MSAAIHVEHARRLRAYETACNEVARAAVAVIALEAAARLNGLGVNTTVAWSGLRLPRVDGSSGTTGTLANSIDAATTAAHSFITLQN